MLEIRKSVNDLPPGGRITVDIIRAGKAMTLSTSN
jgi:S1-C subfamily serine protease